MRTKVHQSAKDIITRNVLEEVQKQDKPPQTWEFRERGGGSLNIVRPCPTERIRQTQSAALVLWLDQDIH